MPRNKHRIGSEIDSNGGYHKGYSFGMELNSMGQYTKENKWVTAGVDVGMELNTMDRFEHWPFNGEDEGLL